MANRIYENVQGNHLKRNGFDLSHDKKLTGNMGKLIPIMCEEVIPGDSFKNKTELMLRLAPLIAPVYHRVDVYTHFFFVPNRILWKGWEDFITNPDSGLVPPTITLTSEDTGSLVQTSSLADYLGLPITQIQDVLANRAVHVSALPFLAYQSIYQEYYRDENLQPAELDLPCPDEGVTIFEYEKLLKLRTRAWEKDYFTSALPWAQKGDPVTFPFAGSAPVTLDYNSSSTQKWQLPNSSDTQADTIRKDIGNPGTAKTQVGNHTVLLDPNGTLKVNFDEITQITVSQFREMLQLQSFLELNARAGTRYTEYLRARFGVQAQDSRLQRPEYLGGGVQQVAISEVLQTSSSDASTPQANMAGHGISVGTTNEFKSYFPEHGFVIGIMSVMPRSCYQNGLNRMWFRNDLFDYYTPEFAHIGEQEVKNKEIFLSSSESFCEATFGYQSRYNEYKSKSPSVHGEFRNSLSFWTFARNFGGSPLLNSTFIECNPSNAPFAVVGDTVDHLYIQVYNDLKALRPMPLFGTPKSLF